MAILADVHGNLPALQAVLADLSQFEVDRVIVNGDLVNRGPSNVEVMELLLGLDASFTLGNHDDLMRKWVQRDEDIPVDWFGDAFWAGTAWCARRLDEAGWIDVFATFPMFERFEGAGGTTAVVSHGSPRHYREGYGRLLSDEAIVEIVAGFPAEVLVGSHTHRPLVRSFKRHQLLNTGAVGAPFNGDPRAQYLLLTLEDGRWQYRFRAVDYDRGAALAAFEVSGFLAEGGLSARIYYEELRCARSFWTPFWLWTGELGLNRDWDSWERFKVRCAERFQSGPG